MKKMRAAFMMRWPKSIRDSLKKENFRKQGKLVIRYWMTNILGICNSRTREEEKERRIRNSWHRNWKILEDFKTRWIRSANSKWIKEGRKKSISRECLKKTIKISKEWKSNKKKIGLMTSKHKRSIRKCLINKKQTDNVRCKIERNAHKISWIKWLTMFFRSRLIDKSLKKRCLPSMTMSVKWGKDNWKKNVQKGSVRNKKRWDSS